SFGIFQNTLTLDQLAKTLNSNFDMRQFSWIGNMNVQSTMCVLARHVQLASTRTLLEKEFIVGGTNAGSSISIVPFILNSLVGTKFKVVQGLFGQQHDIAGDGPAALADLLDMVGRPLSGLADLRQRLLDTAGVAGDMGVRPWPTPPVVRPGAFDALDL